ncbi:hypothetical protein [Nonomuraea coxensis]|uniref:hypothetical protein n=1 Tax=Nonomuraea coxensis TaxID=404386 RepID=UPI003CCE6AA3
MRLAAEEVALRGAELHAVHAVPGIRWVPNCSLAMPTTLRPGGAPPGRRAGRAAGPGPARRSADPARHAGRPARHGPPRSHGEVSQVGRPLPLSPVLGLPPFTTAPVFHDNAVMAATQGLAMRA